MWNEACRASPQTCTLPLIMFMIGKWRNSAQKVKKKRRPPEGDIHIYLSTYQRSQLRFSEFIELSKLQGWISKPASCDSQAHTQPMHCTTSQKNLWAGVIYLEMIHICLLSCEAAKPPSVAEPPTLPTPQTFSICKRHRGAGRQVCFLFLPLPSLLSACSPVLPLHTEVALWSCNCVFVGCLITEAAGREFWTGELWRGFPLCLRMRSSEEQLVAIHHACLLIHRSDMRQGKPHY
ncbi:uncharacterized protein [Symphalangus syndactylus]|uniref:uncharacterized protein isoform X2 n=1 Tax=Symphalangus syndactylus TaxID=9590 RepID=UPI002441672D|nr:uncharacterized protein LOC129479694 isoform X2 [Symphalangus syndactylus]